MREEKRRATEGHSDTALNDTVCYCEAAFFPSNAEKYYGTDKEKKYLFVFFWNHNGTRRGSRAVCGEFTISQAYKYRNQDCKGKCQEMYVSFLGLLKTKRGSVFLLFRQERKRAPKLRLWALTCGRTSFMHLKPQTLSWLCPRDLNFTRFVYLSSGSCWWGGHTGFKGATS